MTTKATGKEVGTDALANNPPVVSKHSTTKDTSPDLRERLAAIEHERWTDWQKWCHKVLRENCPSAELEKVLQRWDKQIATPYPLLTAAEKASDMEQVDRYWPLIEQYVASQREAVLTELEGRLPSKKYPCFQRAVAPTYSAPVVLESVLSSMDSHHEASRNTGYNAYRKAVTAVIKDMKEQKS